MLIPVYVITCDKSSYLLKGFSYLFNKYFSPQGSVVVGGFNPPNLEFPENFSFYSISDWEYPANLWSDALHYFVEQMPYNHFILMLEDYWINREIDTDAIWLLIGYMEKHPELLKIDLTKDVLYKNDSLDRLSGNGCKDVDMVGWCDLIEVKPPCQYSMSLQAAIWNKQKLLQFLVPGENPWQVEMQGTYRLNKDWPNTRVYGTRQNLLRYVNVKKTGKTELLLDDGFNKFRDEDIRELREIGAI